MKRLFLLILFCTTPCLAHATLGEDIFYTWEGVKASVSNAWTWTGYGGRRLVEKVANAADSIQSSVIGVPSIDEKLLPYVSGADFQAILDNNVDFIINGGGLAGYQGGTNNIQVSSEFFKYSPEYGQALIHHEVQHLKDAMTLKEVGFSATDQGHVGTLTLDQTSQGALQAVLEARAYGEEIVFAYNNKELYSNDPAYQKAYDDLVAGYDLAKAFDNAIQEGQTVEEARHSAEIDFLNSDFFKNGYLDFWVGQESDNLLSLPVDDILGLFNDGKLTKEDVYAADKFWENLCSYEKTKESDECLAYFARKKRGKDCAKIEEKWGNCSILGTTLAGDKLGARIFTTEEDDALYEGCCK